MSCQGEEQLMLYVDGEIGAAERAGLESHLSGCPRCRQQLAAIRCEVDIIAGVLRQTEPRAAPVDASGRRQLAWAALALAVLAGGMRAGLDLLAQLGARLGWLASLIERQQISVVFMLFFGISEEDIVMLFTRIAALASVLLLVPLFASLARRRFAATTAALLLLALASVPASATEFRRPEQGQGQVVVVAAGETIDDTVVAIGREVVVEGTITGDLIAVAQRVRVPGEVRGSLLALGRDVAIEGSVAGDVYSASQNFDLRGSVLRNVHAAGGDIDIVKGARVARDAFLACEGARIGGSVGRDVRAVGDVFTVSGDVARNVSVSGHMLDLTTTARVNGSVTAYVQSNSSFSRAPGAQLGHEPEIHVAPKGKAAGCASAGPSRWLRPSFYFWQGARVVAALALGLLLYWLLPSLFAWAAPPERHLLRSGGVGFLALVATPVAAVLLCLTVIGLPIGILAFLVWLVAVYLSGIFVALMLGQLLLRSRGNNGAAFALALLVGLAIVRLAVNLPFLGGVIELLVIVVGLGMLVAQLVQMSRRLRTPVTV